MEAVIPTVLKVLDERNQLVVKIKLHLDYLQKQLPNIASAIEKDPSSARELRQLAHDIEHWIGLFAYKKVLKCIVQRRRNWNRIILFRYPDRCKPAGSLLWFVSKLEDLRNNCKGYLDNAKDGDPAPRVAIANHPQELSIREMGDTVVLKDPLSYLLELLQPPRDGNPEEGNHKVMYPWLVLEASARLF